MQAWATPRRLTGTALGTIGVLWVGVVLGPSAEDTEPAGAGSRPTSSRPAASAEGADPTTIATRSAPTTRTSSRASGAVAGSVAVRVTDGDTLTLADGRTVRLAQVDAPETRECFGSESTAALETLVDGRTVELRRPTDGPEHDRYGRTLADVTVGGASVNETLVRDGAAEWYEDFADEDVALAGRLQAAESDARGNGRGLWAMCSSSAAPPPTTVAPVTAAPPSRNLVPAAPPAMSGGNCDPAYPTVCIPSAPPDLDCGGVPHRRFEVRAPDPHGFDGNDDGIGCESG